MCQPRLLPFFTQAGNGCGTLARARRHLCGDRTTMPTIGRIGPLSVMIFRNDHDPPHFHVFGADFSAKFAIADTTLLSSNGRLRR